MRCAVLANKESKPKVKAKITELSFSIHISVLCLLTKTGLE